MSSPKKATKSSKTSAPSRASAPSQGGGDSMSQEDILPRAAAKPQGKTLWVIGIVLLAAYFFMDKEHRVELPVTFKLVNIQSLQQDQQMAYAGVQAQLTFDLALAAGYRFEGLLNSQAVFTEKPISAEFKLMQGQTSDMQKLSVSLMDQGSEMWQHTYNTPIDHQYKGLYASLLSTLKSVLDLQEGTQVENPFQTMSAADFTVYIQGLGAFTLGHYKRALEYWSKFPQGYDRPVLLNWYIAMAYAAIGEQEQARIYYAFAVSGYPKLAKNLPDWILGLKS